MIDHVSVAVSDLDQGTRFYEAVLGAIGSFRFNPAELDGRRVKQLVQMPFQFSLHK